MGLWERKVRTSSLQDGRYIKEFIVFTTVNTVACNVHVLGPC